MFENNTREKFINVCCGPRQRVLLHASFGYICSCEGRGWLNWGFLNGQRKHKDIESFAAILQKC